MKANQLLALLLVTTLGCIEAAPDSQGNNGQPNNGQPNNGESNNGSNNGQPNNGLSNNGQTGNNIPNNANNVNSPDWFDDRYVRRVRFDNNLPTLAEGFVASVVASITSAGFNPANVLFTDGSSILPHDYEAGSAGSYWLKLNNAETIWMYFDSAVPAPAYDDWGATAMFHFGSDVGFNSNGSGSNLGCVGAMCRTISGLRGSAFADSQNRLEMDVGPGLPVNAEHVTLVAWLKIPRANVGQNQPILDLRNAQGCGCDLKADDETLRLTIYNGGAACDAASSLVVDLPQARDSYQPLFIRFQREIGKEKVSLRYGRDKVEHEGDVPHADKFVIGGGGFIGEVDELQILPYWIDDDPLDDHIENIVNLQSVSQGQVEIRPDI